MRSNVEVTVRKHFKLALAIVLTAIVTSIATAFFTTQNVRENTWAAFIATAYDMEASNDLHRIKSWDSLEQLLLKGCNKEALEYIKMEQSLGLSSLKWHLDNGAKLEKRLEEENRPILSRARSFTSKGSYNIPTCN